MTASRTALSTNPFVDPIQPGSGCQVFTTGQVFANGERLGEFPANASVKDCKPAGTAVAFGAATLGAGGGGGKPKPQLANCVAHHQPYHLACHQPDHLAD